MPAKAHSTIGTVLKYGTKPSDMRRMCRIKGYPELYGPPDLIESTDMEDKAQAFVPGVRTYSAFEFTANFSDEYYEIDQTSGQEMIYYLEMEMGDVTYCLYWKGVHFIAPVGGNVNEVRDMKISCIPTSLVYVTEAEGNIIDETGKRIISKGGFPIRYVIYANL